MPNPTTNQEASALDTGTLSMDQIIAFVGSELDRIKQQSKEIRLLIDQSRSEIEKMKQRQASEAMRLKQIQASFDSVPREDIRRSYESSMDAQQRLFAMSGQMERLQAQQSVLEDYAKTLESIHDNLRISNPEATESGPAPKSVAIRIIDSQEAERLRLSRLMHDGPAQVLSNFILQAEIAARLFEVDPTRAKEELTNLKSAANSTFQRIRNFIFELRPMMLDDLGLIPTIRRYLDAFKEQGTQEIVFNFTGTERRIPSHVEVVMFRAIQQLVGIAREQGQASKIKTTLDLDDVKARVVMEYDGKILEEESGGQADGLGLIALRERVEMIGGSFEYSAKAGQGTYVLIEVPYSE
jgi:two-component system, NarL family, sensor histidine kinase DegS